MLSYIKSQQPAAIAFFVLLFWILKLPFLFLHADGAIPEVHTIWFDAGVFLPGNPVWSFFIAQLCLLTQAIWFNYLFHKADYHESNTMVPAVYFTLVTCTVPAFNYFNLYQLLGFLLLFLFSILLQINSKEAAKAESYNAGFVSGILILLLPGSVLFIPFLFLSLYVLKPFRFNEYLLMLMGIVSPLYMAVAANYLLGYPQYLSVYWEELFHPFESDGNIFNIILLVLTDVYLLFSFVSLRGILYSVGFKRRKNVNMIVFFFLGMTAVVLGSGRLGVGVLALLWIPVGIFLTLLILRARRKKVPEILHAVFVLTIFIINIVRIVR